MEVKQKAKELIEKEKPDFILSTLPTYMHEEVAVYALKQGVHVFSEKPMALDYESCLEMMFIIPNMAFVYLPLLVRSGRTP